MFLNVGFTFWILNFIFLNVYFQQTLSSSLTQRIKMLKSNSNSLSYNEQKLQLKFHSIEISQSIIKTYSISDLHADSDKNMNWIKTFCQRKQEDLNVYTILLLPGDIGTEVDRLEEIFYFLKSQYNLVCYINGNHELWRRGTMIGNKIKHKITN